MKKRIMLRLLAVLLVMAVVIISAGCSKNTSTDTLKSDNSKKSEEKSSVHNETAATSDSEKYEFKLAHHVQLDHPLNGAGEEFAKLAAEKSNGKIEITQFGGGQLGGLKDNTEGVRLGTIEMAWIDLGTVGMIYPRASVIGLPFLFRDYDHVHKFFDGEVGKGLTDEIVEATGIRFLQYADSGFRSIVSNKPVAAPDDMKGLKIRLPEVPIYVQTMNALGANPTAIPFGEVYTALQTGVVDAMECPCDALYISKVFEVTKYITRTNHIYADIGLAINEDLYQSLPDDIRKALSEAAQEAINSYRKSYVENDNEYYNKLISEGMEEVKPDKDAFVNKVKVVWDDFAKNADAQDLIDAITDIK